MKNTKTPPFLRLHWDVDNFAVPIDEGEIITPQKVFLWSHKFDPTKTKLRYKIVQEESNEMPDFPRWCSGAMIASKKACDTFTDIFSSSCTLYPTRWNKKPYAFLFVNNELDAFDLTRSEYMTWGNRQTPLDDVRRIRQIAFRPGFTTDLDIFRLYGGFSLVQEIIVSSRFYKQYKEAEMTGLLFQRVLMPEPTVH